VTDPAEPGALPEIDTTVPHSARIWNYWLGGKDNYEVDRIAGDQWAAVDPGITTVARESRAFLKRSVTYLAGDVGIRQFIDVGTGLPTLENTHEVAQRIAPESRIVYVDNDPLVLVHAKVLLTSSLEGATRYLDTDMYEPENVISGAAEILDLDQPVGLIIMGTLGHVNDVEAAKSILYRLLEPLVPGSYLALQDGTSSSEDSAVTQAEEDYADSGAVPYRNRAPGTLRTFFDGLELVEPGFVSVTRWRPERAAGLPSVGSELPATVNQFGGVARKP